MIADPPMRVAQADGGARFSWVLRGRAKARRARVFEAAVIAVLVWLGTQNPFVAPWFAITVVAGAIEGVFARRALAAPSAARPPAAAAPGAALRSAAPSSAPAPPPRPRPRRRGRGGGGRRRGGPRGGVGGCGPPPTPRSAGAGSTWATP